jgi:hypothetical protein
MGHVNQRVRELGSSLQTCLSNQDHLNLVLSMASPRAT